MWGLWRGDRDAGRTGDARHEQEGDVGDGRLIDPDDVEFQLGRYLYDAQVLHADAAAGRPVGAARVMEVCERYARLINLVGLLRAECKRASGSPR
jgi:hypothetical protein